MDAAMLKELEPMIVQGIIGHVSIFYAEAAFWRHCVADGRMTVAEEARLRHLARFRLERYIAGKLRQQREVGHGTE